MLALLRRLQQQVNEVSQQVGPEGPAGASGEIGPKGEDGAEGVQGVRGPAGERGSDGLTGAEGRAGEDGKDGVGVESVSQAADGDLVFTLSDGTEEVIELPYGLSRPSQGDTVVYHQAGSGGSNSGGPPDLSGSLSIDGGSAVAVYLSTQRIDGGKA